MTIILFLVDTSASMCQRAHVNGVHKSYLDIAKAAVETFLKFRQRSQDCMGDRYMLLTFEDPPCNVKAGWKENHATFMNELKNLQANGLTSMGEALKNAFDLLNLNRMQSGIDTYGQGRCPFYLEPSVIIVLTDGGKYSYRNGVHQEIILPLHAQIPGAKLTKEPFRWDQRLFSLVLRMAGNRTDERFEGKVPHDDSPIEKMCEVTGGRSYRIKNNYVLNQCIESLVQKVQPGVVVHFDQLIPKDLKDGEIQDIAFQSTKKMIYVTKNPMQKAFPVGFWPIPEPYWPDQKAVNLPPRDAHPKLRIITPCIDEPQVLRNFPADKYDVEPSPLTLQILSKREPNKCWSVIVSNGIHGLEMPFGYLKANNTFTQVYLVVLPYNYPTLMPLLNDLFHKFNLNPPNDWLYKISTYVRTIPQYYCPFLRRALINANVPYQLLQYILPETLDSYLSPAVANYLKQMKNTAKQEHENLCLRVFKQLKQQRPAFSIEATRLTVCQPLRRDMITHPMLRDTFTKMHSEINTIEHYTAVVPTVFSPLAAKNFRNPFDIPRRELVDEIGRMRENFFRLPTTGISLYTKDAGHCLPISEMGNYQEYLKSKETPLREIEPTNVRQHMFGNPYKKDKHMVMVDEADLGDVAPMKQNAPNAPVFVKKPDSLKMPRKRKAGPIRRDFIFRRSPSHGGGDSANFSEIEQANSGSGSFNNSDSVSVIDEDSSSSELSGGGGGSSYASMSSPASSQCTTAASDDDDLEESRLVVDFEFNEEPAMDDFPINGHVQDFINGDIDGDADELEIVTVGSSSSSRPIGLQAANEQPPAAVVVSQTPPLPPPLQSIVPTATVAATAATIVAATAAATATAYHQPISATVVVPPVPIIVPAAPHERANGLTSPMLLPQGDINDAHEISRILQQCHNGGVGTSIASHSATSSEAVAEPVNANEPLTVTTALAIHHTTVAVVAESCTTVNATAIVTATATATNAAAAAAASAGKHHRQYPTNEMVTGNGNVTMANHQAVVTDSAVTTAIVAPTIPPQSPSSQIATNHVESMGSPYETAATTVTTGTTTTTTPTTTTTATSLTTTPTTTTTTTDTVAATTSPPPPPPPPSITTITTTTTPTPATIAAGNDVDALIEDNTITSNNGELPLNDEQKENIRQHNNETRTIVFKDIRRPGRDYSQLMEHLSLVKGNFDTKFNFVQMCINESLRFRRKKMADTIQEWWESQIDNNLNNTNNFMSST